MGNHKGQSREVMARALAKRWENYRAADRADPSRIHARFWARVDKSAGEDGCWLWTGDKTKQGYGVFWLRGRVYAHRYSLEIAQGKVADDLCVLHSCDNPRCVNPAHLKAGTKKDNTQDMMAKGRHKFVLPSRQTGDF